MAELVAVVTDESVFGARGGTRLVGRLDELHVLVRPEHQLSPADARAERDGGTSLRAPERDPRTSDGRRRRIPERVLVRRRGPVGEHLVDGDLQLGCERVQRAHRGMHLPGLDPRDRARGEVEPACELAEPDAVPESHGAQARPQRERRVGAVRHGRPLAGRHGGRGHASPAAWA